MCCLDEKSNAISTLPVILKTQIIIFIFAFLLASCGQEAPSSLAENLSVSDTPNKKNLFLDTFKTYEKVLLISVDTNLYCEDLKPDDMISKEINYECFVLDSHGQSRIKKTTTIELEKKEKEFLINFYRDYRDTLGGIEHSDNGTMPVFRDAILFFEKKEQKRPSRFFCISFSNSLMWTPTSKSYLKTTLVDIEPLAKIFIKHGLKSRQRSKWI